MNNGLKRKINSKHVAYHTALHFFTLETFGVKLASWITVEFIERVDQTWRKFGGFKLTISLEKNVLYWDIEK